MSMPIAPDSEDAQRRARQYLKIAERVRTGEYFREARGMYDIMVNDPMAERYAYLLITAVSLLILLITYNASQGLYPLNKPVPLTYITHDFVEDMPHVRNLRAYKNEDPSEAVLRFVAYHYITIRERYDINSFDRDVNGVKGHSSDEVYKEYQQLIDPRNPESPITVYQRHSRRKINILRTIRLPEGMEVFFEAVVESRTDVKKSQWRVNMGFQFSGVELDEKSDKVKNMNFVVTSYTSKRLQDKK